MVAAVYIVGGPTSNDRDDLRHSLRSLVNAPVIDEVWIVGSVPEWVHAVRMPLEPLPEKFSNQRQSIERFVNYPAAPENFYLFNDDMFIVEPVEGLLPTCRNKHLASSWLKADTARPNVWHRQVTATARWVGDRTGTDPHIYECHTPLLFDTAKLREAINAYPADRPFAVGEMYPLAGAGGVGEHRGNAKCKAHDSFAAKLANPMPFLSCSPDTWLGKVGEYARAMFPAPCEYENDVEALGVAA